LPEDFIQKQFAYAFVGGVRGRDMNQYLIMGRKRFLGETL
jgi:hypothetical protein